MSTLQAVAIGGSAGSFDPLVRLLAGLPEDLTAPVVVVLHQPRGRPGTLAHALQAHCPRPVREVDDKEPLTAGTIHLAPPGYHLLVERGPAFALSVDAPVHFSLPSIDVLFESAASVLGPGLAGIVLSGANQDGAAGLRAVHEAGGTAMVQLPDEAGSRAMPEAAIAACPGALVLPVGGMLEQLRALAGPAAAAGRGGA